MEIYEKNPEWTKEIMQQVADKTGLSEAQVYKWGWDQKRKVDEGSEPSISLRKGTSEDQFGMKRKQKSNFKCF